MEENCFIRRDGMQEKVRSGGRRHQTGLPGRAKAWDAGHSGDWQAGRGTGSGASGVSHCGTKLQGLTYKGHARR